MLISFFFQKSIIVLKKTIFIRLSNLGVAISLCRVYCVMCKVTLSIHQWCADLQIPSPRNSASASVGSASANNSAGEWGLGRLGVGPCQLSSADSIYDLTLQTTDNFLTPAALVTCTALAHAAWACICMVCFSAGYILPELRKFICAK